MFRNLDDRQMRRMIASIYRSAVLVTLGALFVFGPLQKSRSGPGGQLSSGARGVAQDASSFLGRKLPR